jgi:hypothetical protein
VMSSTAALRWMMTIPVAKASAETAGSALTGADLRGQTDRRSQGPLGRSRVGLLSSRRRPCCGRCRRKPAGCAS